MFNHLLKVARPQFLIGVLGLFLFGALWAVRSGASFPPQALAVGYLCIASAQLSVHFSNDYFDAGTDQPGTATLISGGSGMLAAHPELRRPVLLIAIGLSALSLGLALLLMRLHSYPWWMMGLAILGNLAGWCYSTPPVRLSARGLGELCYILAGGLLVPAVGYAVVRGGLDLRASEILFPLLLYGAVSMLAVQIPDVEVDRLGDKRTWVSRMGREFGFTAAGMCLLAASLYFFLFPVLGGQADSTDMRMLGWLSLFPTSIGLWSWWKQPVERQAATRLAIGIILGLSVFSLLVDGYLVLLVMQ